MKRYRSRASDTERADASQSRRGVEGGSPAVQEIYRLQAVAGNAAVNASLGQLRLQRHDVAAGAETDAGAGPLPTPNPVIAALWKNSVQTPLRAAANAMSDEKPDYATAFGQASSARDAVYSASGSLPKGDVRGVKASYLLDDLALTETVLAPRANVTISTTDDQIAAKLGGLEWDAAVVGESLGGDPAPRQKVVPGLGDEATSGNSQQGEGG
jgi:hypothetical protein